MNAAKQIQQSGSESSNAMSLKQEKSNELQQLRKVFAGSRAEVVFTDDGMGVEVYRYMLADEKCVMLGFSGKRAKPDFHYRFASVERADAYRAKWFESLNTTAQAKQARKAEKAAKMAEGHRLAVGDVLVASWGYDQTNYDYYQVTRLVGSRSVEIRELAQSRGETHWMQGDCVPVKNSFVGEPMVKRVTESGDAVKVRSWGVWAHKKESRKVGGVELFKPDHYTAYA